MLFFVVVVREEEAEWGTHLDMLGRILAAPGGLCVDSVVSRGCR